MKATRQLWLALPIILATLPVHAGVTLADGKLELGGSARVRYEFKNDTDFGAGATDANDTRDFLLMRVRPFFKFLPHPEVAVYFEPQFSGGAGERDNTATAVTATGVTPAAISSGLNDPALGVHQAYIDYTPSEHFTMRLGRQEWAYGDELVIGPVGWHNIGRSFDGVRLRYQQEKFCTVDALWSLLDDAEASLARPNGAVSTEAHLAGVYAAFNLGTYAQALDAYALYRLDDTAAVKPHNYVTGGVRLKSAPSAWDYRFEATGQFGKQANAAGTAAENHREYQLDIEGGYTFGETKKFRVGLEGFLASRDYNQLFPTAHKWLGYIDLFGRRNIMGGVVHLSAQPSERWKLALDAHTIFRTKTSSGLVGLTAASAGRVAAGGGIGGAGASTSRLAGEEIDLTVTYQANSVLSFEGGGGAFIPMGFLKTNAGNEPPLFGYLAATAKF